MQSVLKTFINQIVFIPCMVCLKTVRQRNIYFEGTSYFIMSCIRENPIKQYSRILHSNWICVCVCTCPCASACTCLISFVSMWRFISKSPQSSSGYKKFSSFCEISLNNSYLESHKRKETWFHFYPRYIDDISHRRINSASSFLGNWVHLR